MSNRHFNPIFKDPYFRQKVKFSLNIKDTNDFGQPELSTEDVTLTSIVYPSTPDELAILPEGERHKSAYTVFTKRQVSHGDYMFYNGIRYKLMTMEAWNHYGYYASLAIRYDGTEADDSEGFEPPTI